MITPPVYLSQSAGPCSAVGIVRLTQEKMVPGQIPAPATYFRFSFRRFKKGGCVLVVKYVVIKRVGSLPRNSVVRLTDP